MEFFIFLFLRMLLKVMQKKVQGNFVCIKGQMFLTAF